MPVSTKFVEKDYLTAVALPSFEGGRYTTVSHESAIDNMHKTFDKFGFRVKQEQFKSANNGLIATGTFTLNIGDSEMGMMVGFINSYNKSVSFRFSMGTNIYICDNMNILGANYASYRRKHMGDVNVEAFLNFDDQCQRMEEYFKLLQKNREKMKEISISKKVMAELAGRMFIDDEIITATQLGIIKREIQNPSYDYGTGNNTVWDFYQASTVAGKSFHPSNYLEGHEQLSNFIINEFGIIVKEEPKIEIPAFEVVEGTDELVEVEYSDKVYTV